MTEPRTGLRLENRQSGLDESNIYRCSQDPNARGVGEAEPDERPPRTRLRGDRQTRAWSGCIASTNTMLFVVQDVSTVSYVAQLAESRDAARIADNVRPV